MSDGDNDNGEIEDFDPNPSPEVMARELLIDHGVSGLAIAAGEVENARGNDLSVQYWLKVTRALADRLIKVT